MKRADTQKERDEELLNGLLKLDAPKLEVWRYFPTAPISLLNNCGRQERGYLEL